MFSFQIPQPALESNTLVVHNLPPRKDPHHVRNRLRQLSENCGGKVIHNSNNNAIIKFPNAESALRLVTRKHSHHVLKGLSCPLISFLYIVTYVAFDAFPYFI